MTTAIIGGGAAGVAAALAAAQQGQQVLVLERGAKPLKKLGVTGNGRANVLNSGSPAYYGDTAFAQAVLRHMDYPALVTFFQQLGVPLRTETEGRVYPAALLASVVVDALLLRAQQLGVIFQCGTKVERIQKTADGFAIHAMRAGETVPAEQSGKRAKKETKPATDAAAKPVLLHAQRVIIACGGAAAPAHGTDGSGYALLTAFGHTCTPLKPALCALLTDKRRIAGLSGQRVRARLTLSAGNGQRLHATEGEALFGDDAISGIAAMQLARFVADGARLTLDLRPAVCWGDFAPGAAADVPDSSVLSQVAALAAMRGQCSAATLLTGAFPTPVARFLCREAGIPALAAPIHTLPKTALANLADAICGVRLPITGTRGFAHAQVTAGGITAAEFDPATLESKLCKGLYAAGEVLDVDGDCGGFNLMFAFASGLSAGRAGR